MTDCLIPSGSSQGAMLADTCRMRYRAAEKSVLHTELKHSKSDDLVLQSGPESEYYDNPLPLQRALSPDLPYEGAQAGPVRPKSSYFSDSEPDISHIGTRCNKMHTTTHHGLYDSVDPEESIRDMISENDFYR